MPNPQSTAQISGHPIHPMLVPFPIAFFVGTFVCDLVYSQNADPFWFTASQWLLAAGVVMALLAALAGFTDLFSDARIRDLKVAWFHMGGNLLAVIVEAVNWYLRYDSGETAVIPTGLVLSIVAVLILLVTGWLGGEMVYRHRVGVTDEPIL